MIKAIMTYKKFMPEFIWHRLRKSFWSNFWKKELVAKKRELGLEIDNTESLIDSERACLNEAILDNYPFESLLEVGCAYGQNFHILCKLLKDTKFIGVDPDPERVFQGLEFLKEKGFHNVELKQFSGIDLKIFPDKSFDVVISSACLLYLPAEKIEFYATELVRVAKKKIILLEQNSENEDAYGNLFTSKDGLPNYWLRNYFLLFSKIGEKNNIRVKKVPKPIWTTEEWQRDASVIEIQLSS